jgi:hypothetical protein
MIVDRVLEIAVDDATVEIDRVSVATGGGTRP